MPEWLGDLLASPTAWVVALIAAVTALFYLGRWIGASNSNVKSLNDRAEEDRKNFRQTAKVIKSDLGDAMRKVNADFGDIRNNINEIFLRLPPPRATISGSPLKLTPFGESLSQCMDAEAWAWGKVDEFRDKVKGKEDFEIDLLCTEYVDTCLSESYRNKALRCAYQFGVDESEVKKVLVVVLRNTLLPLS